MDKLDQLKSIYENLKDNQELFIVYGFASKRIIRKVYKHDDDLYTKGIRLSDMMLNKFECLNYFIKEVVDEGEL